VWPAVPFCSTLLADLGRDVVVITAPQDPFGIDGAASSGRRDTTTDIAARGAV